MKKLGIIAACILLLTACRLHPKQPDQVAKAFLTAYFDYDLERAMELADETTRQEIARMKSRMEADGVTPEELRAESEKMLIEVTHTLESEDYVICEYLLKRSADDANAMTETLFLVKEGEKWKVVF